MGLLVCFRRFLIDFERREVVLLMCRRVFYIYMTMNFYGCFINNVLCPNVFTLLT